MTYDRPFLCLSRTCVDAAGERTVLGIVRRDGALNIEGPVAMVHRVGNGWEVFCACGVPRDFFGKAVHWHDQPTVTTMVRLDATTT